MNKDRARGALLGLAVGDALGTTYEFERLEQPAYPTLATGPATDVVGRGPFALPAGAVTDDTQLAVCLARSLADCGGWNPADVARRYVAWMESAFDIGNQTGSALRGIAAGQQAAGVATWRTSGHQSAGNGSLMRTAPLAVALAAAPAHSLLDAAIAESSITHADPRCALACAAFDAAIAHGVREGGDGRAMFAAAQAGLAAGTLRLAAAWAHEDPIERELVARARVALETDLVAAAAADPGVYGELHLHRTAGFVRVAFRLAFWHLLHTTSWRAALVDVASRGGDADTNAAIVGALLGSRDGASAIPEAWVLRVLSATQRGPAVWGAAHHPRHLLVLAE